MDNVSKSDANPNDLDLELSGEKQTRIVAKRHARQNASEIERTHQLHAAKTF
jgi:hypothetical protein